MTHAATTRFTTKRIRKKRDAFTKLAAAFRVKEQKGVAKRAMVADEGGSLPKQKRQMLSPINSMNETSQPTFQVASACSHDPLTGIRPQHLQRAVDAPARRKRIAKSKACSDQAHDLLVAWVSIAMNEIDRIAASCEIGVAFGEQRVEMLSEAVHSDVVLAILPSQPQ